MNVHSRSIYLGKGLGHESCIKPVHDGYCLCHPLECLYIIRCFEDVCVSEVSLVLRWGNFMMSSLYFKFRFLKGHNYLFPYFFASVNRKEFEINSRIQKRSVRFSTVTVSLDYEELRFQTCLNLEPHTLSSLDNSLQNISRISLKWCTVRLVDITDKSYGLFLTIVPGKEGESKNPALNTCRTPRFRQSHRLKIRRTSHPFREL